MIVFAMVLAALVLLALVSERLAGRLWNRAHPGGPLTYCPRCAARHPTGRIATVAGAKVCPRGHAIVQSEPANTLVGTALIFLLAAFIVCSSTLLAVGVIKVP